MKYFPMRLPPAFIFIFCLLCYLSCAAAGEATVRSLTLLNEREIVIPFERVKLKIFDPVTKNTQVVEPKLVISPYSCIYETSTGDGHVISDIKKLWRWQLSSITPEPGIFFSFWSSTQTPPTKLISIQNNDTSDSYLCWSEYLLGAIKYIKITKSDASLIPDKAGLNNSQACFIPIIELLGSTPFEGVNAQF